MKLTKSHQSAGAIRITSTEPNSNGSWTAMCDLAMIDRESNGSNYRKYSKRHSKEISGDFIIEAARNPILLWKTETKSFITIDGRHSLGAFLANGYNTWTCDIHFNATTEKASSVFYEMTQNSKRMAPWDAYAAALSAKYQFALDIKSALIEMGFTSPKDSGFNGSTADFCGFTPLRDAIDFGYNFLIDFLKILKIWKATGKCLEDVARGNVFQRGLLDFLENHHRHYQIKDIVFNFKRYTSTQIMGVAEMFPNNGRVDRHHYKKAFEFIMNQPSLFNKPPRKGKQTSSKLVKA